MMNLNFGTVEQRLAGIEEELHQLNKTLMGLLRLQSQQKVVEEKCVLCPICGFPLKRRNDSTCVTCEFCGSEIYLT